LPGGQVVKLAMHPPLIIAPEPEYTILDIQNRLLGLYILGKGLGLVVLDITVWFDNKNMEIIGIIDPVIALTPLEVATRYYKKAVSFFN
jgi:hypothetical protein